MIKVKNLTHYYGPHKAIDSLTFNVDAGKLVGFLGPNGAGKTTTMKILSGFSMPAEGDVWISDIHLFSHPLEAKRQIGYLPDQPPLYEDMGVREYLEFVALLKGVDKNQVHANVDEVIETMKIAEVAFRPIHRLSKGFRQRVGLAQAFVSKPSLIILDEPTVGFDPQQTAEFRKLISQMRGKHTIIWSTHILSDVEATCDEIIVINKGHIIAQGTYAEMTKKIRGKRAMHLYVKTGSDAFAAALREVKDVVDVRFSSAQNKYDIEYVEGDINDTVLRLSLEHQVGVVKMESDSKDLEGLFLELTNQKSPEVRA